LFVLYVLGVVSFVHNACLDNERALWMVALAGNFYIFVPRLTARLAAVLLAVLNIAAAWNVRAFLVLLVFHGLLRSIVFWLLNSLTGAASQCKL
jgi:hypothetical protein